MLDVTNEAARYATDALGDLPAASPTRSGMETDLLDGALFIDDGLWCEETAERPGLTGLRFEVVRDPRQPRNELHVQGLDDPLHDPRVLRLLSDAAQYRGPGIVLRAAPIRGTGHRPGRPAADWRLAHVPDEPVGYSATRSDPMIDSLVDLDSTRLARMVEAGQPLAAIFETSPSSVRSLPS